MTNPALPARQLALAATLLFLAGALPAQAQAPRATTDLSQAAEAYPGHDRATPVMRAVRLQGAFALDGRLDDAAWAAATPASDFRQSSPTDGADPSERTEIRLLFDDDALYVGARMWDSQGREGIRSRLVRRDQWSESDYIQLIFDTYHDHIGRTSLSVNPAGVKRDAGVASQWMDSSWDPVWDVATSVDSAGWSAEFRIPFSQLRFAQGKEQTWGLQIWRHINRLNENLMWSYWTNTESGGAQRFGHVEGLEITGSPQRLEVLPYLVARSAFTNPAEGDPFHDGSEIGSRAGADVKYLVTSNLTLNATFNPDFGQVEVDPAVVNLSAFETFFPERRPFFIEGGGAFSFGGFNCQFCSNVSSLSLFFSRRIGRSPQGGLPSDTEWSDVPDNSKILGAAKLTGRLKSGLSLGVLNAVTSRETARLVRPSGPDEQVVEPLTNYFVGRVKQDLNNGNVTIGGMVTSVVRSLGDEPLLRDRLSSHAEAVGLDWQASWKDRTWSFMGNLAASSVSGDPSAMLRIQRSSARYFQRPDREHGGNGLFSDRLDSAATHLRGYGGYARLGKDAGLWRWEGMVNFRSPGFEVNDLAFNTRSDYFWMNSNFSRSWPTTGPWYRWLWSTVGGQQQYNYDGDLTDRQFHGGFWGQFLNYWNFGGFVIIRPEVSDDRATRGGPVVRRPASWFVNTDWGTDSRKDVSFNLGLSRNETSEGGYSNSVSLDTRLRPASNITVSFGPSWSKGVNTEQYVQSVSDPTRTAFFGRRYVFANTEQTTVSMNTRLNVTFTPDLTLELFAQPFISSVDYSRFKEFTQPRQIGKTVYGVDAGSITPVTTNGELTRYDVDPDGTGPAGTFSIANPSFVFRSLRGNAVLRWEYSPGSTLFLVWTQNRGQVDQYTGDFGFSSSNGGMFGRNPDNVFLVKLNYWLSL